MQEPKPISSEDLNPQVFQLYDAYVHGDINRKTFMQRLAIFASATLSVNALADFLLPKYACAQQIQPHDSRLKSERIAYTSVKGAGTMKGLLVHPAQTQGKHPGVIVVHENRGLNPYIEDVARRLGIANYLALAPDALTPLGGYPGNDDAGRELQSKRNREEMLADFIAAFDYLKTHPACTGHVGVIGFCFGGYISNQMAALVPDLACAVPFYGGQALAEQVPQIKAPLQLHYAEDDPRVNAGWPDYEAALKKAQKSYQVYFYPGTQHGFHNDTTPRFQPEAAQLAWERTLTFFARHLA